MGRRQKKLAVALVCSDWRLHHSKTEFNRKLRTVLRVEGVDYVAVPGPDGLPKPGREAEWKTALDQAKLLISAHAPIVIAVCAHQRCAGHPVSDEAHLGDVAAAAQALKGETGFAGPSHALIAQYRADLRWTVKEVEKY